MTFTRQSKCTNGYTLIELSLFMGLFSIILVVLTTLFSELVQKQLEMQSMSDVETDNAYILSRLQYDLGRADQVMTPANSGSTTNQLVFEVDGIIYTYQLNGDVLELAGNGEALQMNNSRTQISGMTFQRLGNPSGNPSIKIHIDIISKTLESAGPRQIGIDTTLGTR